MLHQEKYTLTWHSSYSDHLKEVLKEMMTSRQFADVTLVTDDKQLIRAHRNILSACSACSPVEIEVHCAASAQEGSLEI